MAVPSRGFGSKSGGGDLSGDWWGRYLGMQSFKPVFWNQEVTQIGRNIWAPKAPAGFLAVKGGPERKSAGRANNVVAFGEAIEITQDVAGAKGDFQGRERFLGFGQ